MCADHKLPGRYKGNRKRQKPPVIVQVECPACGWKGTPGKLEPAEMEYVLHLTNVHYGLLECAFCDRSVSRGLRCLPDFGSLSRHVHLFHAETLRQIAQERGYEVAPGAIPEKAFKL